MAVAKVLIYAHPAPIASIKTPSPMRATLDTRNCNSYIFQTPHGRGTYC